MNTAVTTRKGVGASNRMSATRMNKLIKRTLLYFLVFALIIVFLFPVYLAVVTSFKTKAEVAGSIMALPKSLHFENYIVGIEKSNFTRSLLNSCIVTFPSVALIVICASMGGYSIARFGRKKRFVRSMDKVYLAALMIPFQILMIPVYKLFKTIGMLNSLLGMIIMLTGISIAYATFLYVGFVKSVPEELEQAALIDGCGPYRAFFYIIFPLLQPITATVIALHIMWLWNDFNIALILLQREEVRTLTVKQFYFFGEYTADYGMAFAAALLCMLPVLLFFCLMQRYIIGGIAAGAVKS